MKMTYLPNNNKWIAEQDGHEAVGNTAEEARLNLRKLLTFLALAAGSVGTLVYIAEKIVGG